MVEYSTPEMAQTAIETLNNSKINDTERLIFVREDREDRNFASSIQRNRPYGGGAGAGGFGGGAGAGGNYADRDRGRKIFIGNVSFVIPFTSLFFKKKKSVYECFP